MKPFYILASLLLMGCQQQIQEINDQDYEASLPEVKTMRSAYDYPEGFSENYLKDECHSIPLMLLDPEVIGN